MRTHIPFTREQVIGMKMVSGRNSVYLNFHSYITTLLKIRVKALNRSNFSKFK